jgi:hypothetical protein
LVLTDAISAAYTPQGLVIYTGPDLTTVLETLTVGSNIWPAFSGFYAAFDNFLAQYSDLNGYQITVTESNVNVYTLTANYVGNTGDIGVWVQIIDDTTNAIVDDSGTPWVDQIPNYGSTYYLADDD